MDTWGDFSRTWVRRLTVLAVSRPADLARLRRVNRFFRIQTRCRPAVHARRCKELLVSWSGDLRGAAGLGGDVWVARLDTRRSQRWRHVPPIAQSTHLRMIHDMWAWVSAARDEVHRVHGGGGAERAKIPLQMANRMAGACRRALREHTWVGRLRVLARADAEIRRNMGYRPARCPRPTLSAPP